MRRCLSALALCACSCAAGAQTAQGSADFELLPPPVRGEWRSVFPEPEQSFAEYRTDMGTALAFEKRFIRLLPLGDAVDGDDLLIEKLAAYLGAYYMTRVEVEARRPMPEEIPRRPTRGYGPQYKAEEILQEISRTLPEGTVARLAVTSQDLYARGPAGEMLNFVFGMGGAAKRVGVISVARYRMRYPAEPPGTTMIRRVLKVGAHEVGHIFGLMHCGTYACGMNGSNSLVESDSRPVHLCPLCLCKLAWHLDTDAALRYTVLAGVYASLGWAEEEQFARRRAASPELRGYPRERSGQK